MTGAFNQAWAILKNYTGQQCDRCRMPIQDRGSNAEMLAGMQGLCLSCYADDKYGM